MKTYFALDPAQIAQFYVQSKGDVEFLPTTADALVADVERYLTAHGLGHRLDEAVTIAREAFTIAEQVREQQTSEDFQTAVREGYGDTGHAQQYADELARAAQIAQMDMKTFAAERGRLGIGKSTADFLLGY